MRARAFQLSLFIMLLFGSLDMSRGIAAPLMQHDWHLDYLQIGTMFVSNSLGYLAGSFISGFAADRYGLKPVMMAGGVLSVVGLGTICELHAYGGIMIGFLCMGLGTGWLEIGINSVVPAISVNQRQQAAHFNVLHGFYGLGAFCFPLLAIWMIQETSQWRPLYLLLWAVAGLVLAAIMCMNFRQVQHKRIPVDDSMAAEKSTRSFLKNPVLYFLLCAITMYVMAESGVASWLPTFMVKVHGLTVADSSVYLSGFYLTFTIGRLTGKYWVAMFGEIRSILIFSILGSLSTGTAIFVPHAEWAFIVAGFGYSIIFPTIASVTSHLFAEHAGKVLGFLFTAGGIGSLAVNWWIGYFSTQYGLMFGFSFILLFMLLVLASVGLVAGMLRSKAGTHGQIDVAS